MKAADGARLALAAIAVVLGVLLFAIFDRAQQQAHREEVDQRTGSWLVFQANIEAMRLLEALGRFAIGDPAVGKQGVAELLDIFLSRLPLLTIGEEAKAIAKYPELVELAGRVSGLVAELEPRILSLERGDGAAYVALRNDFEAVRVTLRDFAQQVLVYPRSENEYRSGYPRPFLLTLFGLGLVSAMLLWLLFREIREKGALLARAQLAEGTARRAQDQLLEAIEAAPDGFAWYDSDDRLVVCNARYREIYAESAPAIVERAAFEDILRFGLRNGQYPEAAGAEEDWLAERVLRHRDPGEPITQRLSSGRWIRVSERRTREGGIVCFRSDITEIKARELEFAALASESLEIRKRLANAIEALPGGFALFDGEDRLALSNASFAAMFALEQSETAPTFEELFRRPACRDAFGAAKGRVDDWMADLLAWRRRGQGPREEVLAEGRWIRMDARREADGDIVLICMDVTEERTRREALAQAQKMEAVGQLTGGIAHDVNNLLTVILGNAELLVSFLRRGAEQRALAENISVAAQRGGALIHRLLAFSRKQPLRPMRLELSDLLRGLEVLLSRTLGERVAVRLEAPDALYWINVDKAQLEAALLNLAINARDAMPQGGELTICGSYAAFNPAAAARLPGLAPGKYVRIAVTDTGCGMPPEVQARALEPFFTTKSVGKGSGLGLSMVYGFVKQSSGYLRLDSAVGEGTTVEMYLPLAGEQRAQQAGLPAPLARATGDGRTVLLVEDDDAVREVGERHLAALGYRVLSACNGAEALELFERRSHEIDLVLSDVVMPGPVSGIALARSVRSQAPRIPVLLMSGHSEEAVNAAGDQSFADGLLKKPFRFDELATAVSDVLASAAHVARAQLANG